MLQTDEQFPSLSSQKKGVVINPDSSVDIYFAPKAPVGHETNWVQTWPGQGMEYNFPPLRSGAVLLRQDVATGEIEEVQ
jgi:hypothetical protein